MGRLDRKVAVVTGGAGLLGAAFARALAEEGARVLVNDLSGEDTNAVAEEILDSGGDASAIAGSVTSWEASGRIIDACIDRYERIDCLVNAAHTTRPVPIAELEESDYRATIESHVTGHFACTHHAAQHMIRQGGGSVVNLVSRAMQGLRGYSAYGAAKGAILSATFSWALELAAHGIRVNAVSPAARRYEPGERPSRRMPWCRAPGESLEEMRRRTPSPESVAPIVVYLASEASHWLSGQALFLSGDSLATIRHPKEGRFVYRPEGWQVEDLEDHLRPALADAFERPSMQAGPYAWFDGVGSRGAPRPQRDTGSRAP